jgi:hypothetical protein
LVIELDLKMIDDFLCERKFSSARCERPPRTNAEERLSRGWSGKKNKFNLLMMHEECAAG